MDYTSHTTTSTVPLNATSKKKKPRPTPSAPSISTPTSTSTTTSSEPSKPPPPARKSTAVYITHLPLDTTRSELERTFSKCGIILLDGSNEPKIKLYTDEHGRFKGEAMVMYFKETSVDLAIRVLDESELRLGEGAGRMKVRRAEWGDGMKEDEKGEGEKRVKKKLTEGEKKELSKRIRKMEKYGLPFLFRGTN